MAIKARVYPLNDPEFNPDDTTTDRYRIVFFGPELPQPDASLVAVVTTDSDTLATAETKLVDAVVAEWNRVRGAHGLAGVNLARTRIAFPAMKRGS